MHKCYITTITIAELFTGIRNEEEKLLLQDFINEFEHATLNAESAKRGGVFRRDYGKSHGVGLADSLIAQSPFSRKQH